MCRGLTVLPLVVQMVPCSSVEPQDARDGLAPFAFGAVRAVDVRQAQQGRRKIVRVEGRVHEKAGFSGRDDRDGTR